MDDDGIFGPVGLLADNVDKLQDALDGIHRGDAMIWPRSVVEMEDVPRLISLWEVEAFTVNIVSELRCVPQVR